MFLDMLAVDHFNGVSKHSVPLFCTLKKPKRISMLHLSSLWPYEWVADLTLGTRKLRAKQAPWFPREWIGGNMMREDMWLLSPESTNEIGMKTQEVGAGVCFLYSLKGNNSSSQTQVHHQPLAVLLEAVSLQWKLWGVVNIKVHSGGSGLESWPWHNRFFTVILVGGSFIFPATRWLC